MVANGIMRVANGFCVRDGVLALKRVFQFAENHVFVFPL